MGMRPMLLPTRFTLDFDRTDVCIFARFGRALSPLISLADWFVGVAIHDNEGSQLAVLARSWCLQLLFFTGGAEAALDLVVFTAGLLSTLGAVDLGLGCSTPYMPALADVSSLRASFKDHFISPHRNLSASRSSARLTDRSVDSWLCFFIAKPKNLSSNFLTVRR